MSKLRDQSTEDVLTAVIEEMEALRRSLMMPRPYSIHIVTEKLYGFQAALKGLLPDLTALAPVGTSATSFAAPAAGDGGKKKGKDGPPPFGST